ncbi:sugar phosphate isomerase/epimerase family protein [Pseudonocardia nigra]|uniref:sugar phosphate isomerase/epimerase family protein n=1 Tax=Pseudonocardia nigra TaxID=1921578 RepID=UPI001C5E219B|nr:sugar phosphate isomerase/epimerase [Pseudonocardia nigra]
MSRVSVQLYTVREALADDLPGTLRRLADIGFTQVEPFGLATYAEPLGPALADAGLTAPTTHQSIVGQDLDAIFATAARLGIGTVIDPRVDRSRWESAADVEKVADELNAAAAVAARHGVRVGYHNHAQELEIVLDGTTALEVFAAHLDDTVVLEVDTYWAAVGGQDPVALLGRLGDRVQAIHVKDGPATADVTEQVAVGQGGMPIREIVAAAPNALRVVELDDSRGDRFQAVADSYAWLREAGLG